MQTFLLFTQRDFGLLFQKELDAETPLSQVIAEECALAIEAQAEVKTFRGGRLYGGRSLANAEHLTSNAWLLIYGNRPVA